MPGLEESTATSLPRKNFNCPDCGRAFISGKALGGHKKAHKKSKDEHRENKDANRQNPTGNGSLPHDHHCPYERPNHDGIIVKVEVDDHQPSQETLDLIGEYWTPVRNVQAEGGPADSARSSERTVTCPIIAKAYQGLGDQKNFGDQEVSPKKKEDVELDLDLDLKLYW